MADTAQPRKRFSMPPYASPATAALKVSFEFFPPKTDKMAEQLWAAVKRLEPLSPRFVSVTYGAGGSTRDRTHATVTRIRRETRLEPAAHLTCVGATREEVDAIARRYWEAGVRHIRAFNALGKEEVYARLKPGTEEEKSRIPTNIPYIVIMIDELADLMMTSAKEVEHHLSRLAQKSRAVISWWPPKGPRRRSSPV